MNDGDDGKEERTVLWGEPLSVADCHPAASAPASVIDPRTALLSARYEIARSCMHARRASRGETM